MIEGSKGWNRVSNPFVEKKDQDFADQVKFLSDSHTNRHTNQEPAYPA